MTLPQHATVTNSDTTTGTLRSRSLSKQNVDRQNSLDNVENQSEQQQHQQLRSMTKIRHRLKSKTLILLVPIILIAISSIIGLSIGQIVSDL